MRLTKGLCFKENSFIGNVCRYLCTKPRTENKIKKYVYISQSTDIFTNLAIEDWIYSKYDFTSQEILMLWRSSPCVVIGKHQNPWLEANVEKLKDITVDGVKLARRNSGGGTVYHDEGNLNMTFFTSKESYNRNHNLQIITKALFREYKLKLCITQKEDLALRGLKVSGTASKLTRTNAYHHCTLLINVNKNHLREALCPTNDKIETRATKSIKSSILNLKEEIPKISIDSVLKAVAFEFLHSPCSGPNSATKLTVVENGFHLINPNETWFPGITEIRDNLESWEWVFGKCPEFSESHTVDIFGRTFNVKIIVEKGRINDIKVEGVGENIKGVVCFEDKVLLDNKGREYSTETVSNILKQIRSMFDSNITKQAFGR